MAFPFGRWFGVHLRVHLSFLLLLALACGYSSVATGSILRGLGLWLALVAAVAVREVARAIAAAYVGVPLHALFLLPFGGVMAMEPRPGGLPRRSQRIIALTGTVANFLAALFLLGFAYGVDPGVSLLRQPWITVEHILRSLHGRWPASGSCVLHGPSRKTPPREPPSAHPAPPAHRRLHPHCAAFPCPACGGLPSASARRLRWP